MSAASRNTQSVDEVLAQLGDADTITVDLDGVVIEGAEAAACGAAGCLETEPLWRVEIDGFGQRVVCLEHLGELLKRERGGDK